MVEIKWPHKSAKGASSSLSSSPSLVLPWPPWSPHLLTQLLPSPMDGLNLRLHPSNPSSCRSRGFIHPPLVAANRRFVTHRHLSISPSTVKYCNSSYPHTTLNTLNKSPRSIGHHCCWVVAILNLFPNTSEPNDAHKLHITHITQTTHQTAR